MVRSAAQRRVSNHGAAPSFETGATRPPQDEGGSITEIVSMAHVRKGQLTATKEWAKHLRF